MADGPLWESASARLWQRDAALHSAGLARLVEVDRAGDCVTLAAPSTFVASYVAANFGERLVSAISAEDPAVRAVRVVVE